MPDGYAVVSKGLLADPATVVFTWSVRRIVFSVVCRKSGARDVTAARHMDIFIDFIYRFL